MTWSGIQLKVQNHLYFAHAELYCDCRNCLSTLQALHPDAMKTIPSIVQDLKQLMSAYNVDVYKLARFVTISNAFDVVVEPLVLTPPEGAQSEQKEPQKEEKIMIRLNTEKMKNAQTGVEKRESLESLHFESSSEENSEYESDRGGKTKRRRVMESEESFEEDEEYSSP